MFFCAISGTTPIHPVVSAKSGHVYEKSLIEKYIDENGTDPMSGEGLTKEDLIDVKAKPTSLPPRPPTQTSIPNLLTSLQSEFDAIMLESLEVKKAYRSARQELANALYREDAATRAIARIMKERDEARSALASIQATIGVSAPAANGSAQDGADVDMAPAEDDASKLPADVEQVLMETNSALSSTRKKRKAAPGYATAEDLRSFTQTSTVPSLHATKPAGITSLDVSHSGDLALTGGADKTVQIYDFANEKTLATLKGHTKAVKHVEFVQRAGETAPSMAVSGGDKTVKVWSADESGSWSLASNLTGGKGEVVGLSVHPSKRYVSSASNNSTWSLYDLNAGSAVKTYEAIPDDKGSFEYSAFAGHPDGLLHACGTSDGIVRIWDARDASALAAVLEDKLTGAGGVNSLSFSENGYYLAGSSATGEVKVFDLRKLSTLKSWSLGENNKIHEVRFDPSAQFLSVVGTDARVYANKSFEELYKFDDNAGELTAARFVASSGQKLVLAGLDRSLRVLSKA